MQELLNDPVLLERPREVVPYLAWSERLTVLAAREKEGKSTIAGAGAAAVSAGHDFLGRRTLPGRVLWLALEEHVADVVQRFQRFRGDPTEVIVGDRLPDPLGNLAAAVEQLHPAVVVVDTLAALAMDRVVDPSSSAAWTKIMGQLTAVARESGAAFLILHHSRKSDGAYRDSTAIGAGCDAILEMKADNHDPSSRRISGKGRFDLDGQVGVRLVGDRYELVEGGEESVEARVLGFLHAHPRASSRMVRDGVEGRGSDVDTAVRRLLNTGRIVDHGDSSRRAFSVADRLAGDTSIPQACPPHLPLGQDADTQPDTVEGRVCPEAQPQKEGSGHAQPPWTIKVPPE